MKTKNLDPKIVITTRPNGSRRVQILTQGESMARESLKNETDINTIVARYNKTGTWSHLSNRAPVYADIGDFGDYRDAIHLVREAEEKFMSLPADVRKEFGNDPAQLLDFIKNPANYEKAVKLKLIPQKPQPKPPEGELKADPYKPPAEGKPSGG